jgi:type I restriction enzyme S subunit
MTARFMLREGDFLISRSNTADKVGRVGVFRGGLADCSYPDLMMRFRPNRAELDARYLELYLRSDAIVAFIQKHATGTSGSMKKINRSVVESLPIVVLPIRAQSAIAGMLRDWDAGIEKTERLIAAKLGQASRVRERVIGRAASKHTRLRPVTRESVRRNGTALGREQIMGVTNDRGMRPMREETIASSIDRYKIVRPRAFAYNPMRLNVGSIAMSPFDRDVLVSPDYVVFECDESKLLPGYLNHLRMTRHWASFFDVAGSGSVRVRIYYDDLAAFSFPLPRIEEQHRIVELLDTAVAEIAVLTKYAQALRRQKRGLMQKLLTGQWRLPAPANSPEECSPC